MRAHYDVTLRRNNKELADVAERAHVPLREGTEIIKPSRSFDDCLMGGIPILLFMKYSIRMKIKTCATRITSIRINLWFSCRAGITVNCTAGETFKDRELANNRPSDQVCGRRTEVSRMGYPVRMLERTRTRTKPQPRPTTDNAPVELLGESDLFELLESHKRALGSWKPPILASLP